LSHYAARGAWLLTRAKCTRAIFSASVPNVNRGQLYRIRACNFTCTPAAATANHSRSQPQRRIQLPSWRRRFILRVQLPSLHCHYFAKQSASAVISLWQQQQQPEPQNHATAHISRQTTMSAAAFFADLIYNTILNINISKSCFLVCMYIYIYKMRSERKSETHFMCEGVQLMASDLCATPCNEARDCHLFFNWAHVNT
jgi:hypothetical protein